MKEACRRPSEETANRRQNDENHGEGSFVTKTWDISRIVIAELILYPLTISNLIGLLVEKSYQFNDAVGGLSFILSVISFASLFFYVYIVRLAVLFTLAIRLKKRRKHVQERTIQHRSPGNVKQDERAAK